MRNKHLRYLLILLAGLLLCTIGFWFLDSFRDLSWRYDEATTPGWRYLVATVFITPGGFTIAMGVLAITAGEKVKPAQDYSFTPPPEAGDKPMLKMWLAAALGLGIFALAIFIASVIPDPW